ncbi:adenylate kinase 9 isoform X1 [Hydra vulgaris]|uniref:adenylate kinase 9 isoform X1 n=1 Tax=Hydra vulgaris TaxID=6087 RepID=UPI001F5F0528|nr:adenylate kinase 9 [Hydra vulgaris]
MQHLENVELDPFSDDQAELNYLKSKPTCFIVLGKPGCGKSTLAKEFIKVWRCLLITVSDSILYAIQNQSESGKKAHDILTNGGVVPEHLSLQILSERLSAADVFHYGYILDGFPCYSEAFTIDEQIAFLKNLPLTPDYIINIKISDDDLLKRCNNLKVDPVTNDSYTAEFYNDENDNALIENNSNSTIGEKSLEENGQVDGDEDNEQKDEDNQDNNLVIINKSSIVLRLLLRYEELAGSLNDTLINYKERVLKCLENLMSEHDQQKLIELDGNLSLKLVYMSLLQRMEFEPINQVFVPGKLIGADNLVEFSQDEKSDEILRSLSGIGLVTPGYRWRRSKWGTLCPVAFQSGEMVNGHPEYAVSFLDKMYLLSSNEAVFKFMTSPRQFIVPLQHMLSPYKIVVLGPPLSGTTTLCNNLANQYKIQVINVESFVKGRLKKLQDERLPKLLEEAIIKVKGSEDLAKRDTLVDTESSTNEDKQLLVNEIDINENHPQVIEEVDAKIGEIELSPKEYVDCIEEALIAAFKDTNKDYRHSGWILDNYPQTRDQFNNMVERDIAIDNMFVFNEDSNAPVLVERWNNIYCKGKNKASLSEQDEINLKKYKDSISEFTQSWQSIQSAISSHNAVEVMIIPTNISEQDAFRLSIKNIEAAFQYHPWKYNEFDEEEEEDDYAATNEEVEDEDESNDRNKKKPLGETLHFCPVKLKENDVLWPGSNDFAVKYREKVYFLSNADAQDQFMQNPELFLPQTEKFKIPAIRFMLLGPKGSGKSLQGRLLASKYGLLHISFKDRLQELIIHKTLKKVGPDFQHLYENEENKVESEEKRAEVFDLNPFEKNIYNNIIEGEPLTKETLDAILVPWWKEEPFKSKGFILEGFPRLPEEVNYLTESGLFPDGALFLNVKDEDIYNRLSPSIISRWKKQNDVKMKKKQQKKAEIEKLKEEKRILRRKEILAEREDLRSQKLNTSRNNEDEESEVDEGEDESNIDDIIELELIEEFGEDDEEDEEDNETEEDAINKIKSELVDKYNDESSLITELKEAFDEELIYTFDVDSSRKPQIVQYCLTKLLKKHLLCRNCFFDKCQILKPTVAKNLLKQGYKKLSRFGKWCPVKLYDNETLMPVHKSEREKFPVAYRHFIYFLSSKEASECFIENPKQFLTAKSPKHFVPVKIAVLGPPKSGKTTLANRFVKELGLVRLSIGEAMRHILVSHSKTELVRKMQNCLLKGYVIPDELAIEALELRLLDIQCSMNGYVLDGYPCTMHQFNLLKDRKIIPYKFIELIISDQEILQRGLTDRRSVYRLWPLHDSHAILAIRIACYRKESVSILEFCREQFKNQFCVNAENSKWWVYNEAVKEVSKAVENIQGYIECIQRGRPAPIKSMCITPSEIQSRLGEFLDYCPVSLALKMELVNCADLKNDDLIAEYRGKFYKFSDENNMLQFLNTPTKYVMPLAPRTLPDNERLPKRVFGDFLKNISFQTIAFQGYCPVTYIDGDKKYEKLVKGQKDLVAEFKNSLFMFTSADCLDKFMRSPEKYAYVTLPKKLPPSKEVIDVLKLPRLGYMEQTLSVSIIKALTAVGMLKPIFPFLSVKSSALIYVAYHLKAFNPKSNEMVKAKYKKKLRLFEKQCEIVPYLGRTMKRKYLEPDDRPLDFDLKLNTFFSFQKTLL